MIIGCGRPGTAPKPIDPKAEITQRANIYRSLVHTVQDENGFIEYSHCDSVLFSALLGATSVNVNLRAAEVSPGEWYRRPTTYPECYAAGESRSIISRDMVLGVMFYAWINRDIKMLQDLWNFGSDNNWIMGPAGPADVSLHSLMNQQYITLLAKMIHKLTGRDYTARHLPITINSGSGFTNHLAVLYLILLGEVDGELSHNKIQVLQTIYQHAPRNLLFNAVAEKYGIAVGWDIRWELYPANRLPTSTDRCEAWATQRDDNDPGLRPCAKNNTYSGGDLIFVEWLLRR